MVEIRDHAEAEPARTQPPQRGRRFGIDPPGRGIGEEREQVVEVSAEIGELAEPGETRGDQLAPPSSFEIAQLLRTVARTESEPRRLAKDPAKRRIDGRGVSVDSIVARHARIGRADRIARREERSGRIEKNYLEHSRA